MTRFCTILSAFAFLALSASAQSVHHIPGDYPSIQAALNDAATGDTILVQPGIYQETITWPAVSGLKLISVEGAEHTTIDAQGQGSVFVFGPSDNPIDTTTVVQGFSIVNGQTSEHGGGIFINDASPLFVDIILANNRAVDGAGLYCDGASNLVMRDVEIRNNIATGDGGGVYVGKEASGLFINTRFMDNEGQQGADVFAPGHTRWSNDKPLPSSEEVSSNRLDTKGIDSGVEVFVDPRIELMSVVQLLSDYMLITRYDSNYKRNVSNYFSRYVSHPVVDRFKEMSQAEFNFDAVPNAMLSLDAPPSLRPRHGFSDYVLNRAGGSLHLNLFLQELDDFERESRFTSFYQAHEGTFEQVIDSTKQAINEGVEKLRNYTGMPVRGSVILGMMLHNGGFAATIEEEGADSEVYAIIGPTGERNGVPYFGNTSRIAGLTWHEFSHTFVNPLTEQYKAEIAAYESLQDPIAEMMALQAYPEWEIIVNEHIVRAITTRLAYLSEGEEAGDKALQREKAGSFIYVEVLAERLKAYEADRDQYKTFADFYPQLLMVFEEAMGSIEK